MVDTPVDKEIEITPEMALVGSLVLSSWDNRIEDSKEVVVRVFRAMCDAKE
jgi:hypothetical protein